MATKQQLTQESNRHVKSSLSRKTSLLEEKGTVVDEIDATENLGAVNAHGDFSTAPVVTLEAIQIRATSLELLFQTICFHNKGQGSLNIDFGRCQSSQRLFSVLQAVLANQPPGALGDEGHAREDDKDPKPLQQEWNLVSPVVVQFGGTSSDAVTQELANNEAKVDEGGEVATKCCGTDLRGVSWSNDDEHAQDETSQQLSGQKDSERLGEELDEDDAGSEDDTDRKGELSAKVVHRVSSEDGTDNLADGVAH